MENATKIGLMVLLIFLALFVQSCTISNEHDKIKTWANNNNYIVKNIDHHVFNKGPYWFTDEDDRIYKVELIKKESESTNNKTKIVWFWFGLFGYEVKEE